MKTIQVTDEMYSALMEISKELNTQNHRCTAMPYMIQLSTDKEVAAYEGCGESFWFSNEGEKLETEQEIDDSIKEFLEDKYGTDESFEELDEFEKESILEDLDYRKLEVTTEKQLSNFFFTDKGLRKYYGEDVDTYLTGVTNPELKTVMTFLCELSGGKLHT